MCWHVWVKFFSIKFNGRIRMYIHARLEKKNVQFVKSGTSQWIRLRKWELNIGKSSWVSPIKMSDHTLSCKCDAILVAARTIVLHLLWQCKGIDKDTHVSFLLTLFSLLCLFFQQKCCLQIAKKKWTKSKRINHGQAPQLSHFLLFLV